MNDGSDAADLQSFKAVPASDAQEACTENTGHQPDVVSLP